jgi:hypothetical protein
LAFSRAFALHQAIGECQDTICLRGVATLDGPAPQRGSALGAEQLM